MTDTRIWIVYGRQLHAVEGDADVTLCGWRLVSQEDKPIWLRWPRARVPGMAEDVTCLRCRARLRRLGRLGAREDMR
ncbi:MAG TPA: hypothetical protein VIK93_07775 [Limnochordales bacterium]